MDYIFLIAGLIIIIITLHDFTITTISGFGSGPITRRYNRLLFRVLSPFNNKRIIKYSGLVHVHATLLNWVLLVLTGSFLIFLYTDSMVVNTSTKEPAVLLDRLYFTIYSFSTLGNGDFSPGNSFAKICTGILSLIGFGMLTTIITYLLSVTTKVLDKKNLALLVNSMGNNPVAIYNYAMHKDNGMMLFEKAEVLSERIIQLANNHLTFPVIHYFLTKEKKLSITVQLAVLHEALQVIKSRFKDKEEVLARVDELNHVIHYILSIIYDSYCYDMKNEFPDEHRKIWETKMNMKNLKWDERITERFSCLLKNEGWDWKDVYGE